jgi:hypothetical protein
MNEPIERLRLEAFRALVACLRLEKSSLSAEISSASTTRLRKTEAIVQALLDVRSNLRCRVKAATQCGVQKARRRRSQTKVDIKRAP